MRIINTKRIYVINLTLEQCNEKKLAEDYMFGQFGKIDKIQINLTKPFVDLKTEKVFYSTYISFKSEISTCLAIISLNYSDDLEIECSFGNNKYCKSFLANIPCTTNNCLFLHEQANPGYVYYEEHGVNLHNQVKRNWGNYNFQMKHAMQIAARYYKNIVYLPPNTDKSFFHKINSRFKKRLKKDQVEKRFIDRKGNYQLKSNDSSKNNQIMKNHSQIQLMNVPNNLINHHNLVYNNIPVQDVYQNMTRTEGTYNDNSFYRSTVNYSSNGEYSQKETNFQDNYQNNKVISENINEAYTYHQNDYENASSGGRYNNQVPNYSKAYYPDSSNSKFNYFDNNYVSWHSNQHLNNVSSSYAYDKHEQDYKQGNDLGYSYRTEEEKFAVGEKDGYEYNYWHKEYDYNYNGIRDHHYREAYNNVYCSKYNQQYDEDHLISSHSNQNQQFYQGIYPKNQMYEEDYHPKNQMYEEDYHCRNNRRYHQETGERVFHQEFGGKDQQQYDENYHERAGKHANYEQYSGYYNNDYHQESEGQYYQQNGEKFQQELYEQCKQDYLHEVSDNYDNSIEKALILKQTD